MEYVLTHSGIKGMKWGVRRYQNKDGTLTAAGKKRYNQLADRGGYDKTDESGNRYRTTKKGKTETLKADADKWVETDRRNTKRVLDDSAQITGRLKNINDRTMKNQPRERLDLSKMSDKELRDQINRELLERQYNDVFNPPKVNKGRETASKVLETAGDILVVAGSAVGLALSIQALRNGKG